MILKQLNHQVMKRKPPLPQPTSKYKSKFEAEFANNLTKKKIVFTYETLSIDYTICSSYKPDFILNDFIVETKGYFSKEDRRKHLAIKETRPELDIRFCFQNSKTKLSKAKRSLTYGAWCDRHGFLYCDTYIPKEWYD
ncbi:MAG: hypothetical protein CBD21_00260 [bacterium TMED161]|nr:MAG: hypothetical protein CBD21_00260 [bacterium TMED161]